MGFLARLGTRFKRTGSFFKDSWQELKKVRWPNRRELVSYSTVVLVTVILIAVFFYVIDIGLSRLIDVIMV